MGSLLLLLFLLVFLGAYTHAYRAFPCDYRTAFCHRVSDLQGMDVFR